jgi:hypothetical protein
MMRAPAIELMAGRAIRFQRAAVVANRNAGDLADQPVGDPRRDLARDELVLALHTPTGDEVVVLLERVDEHRNVARIVLEVTVHRDEILTASVRHAGGHGGCLAGVARKHHEPHTRIAAGDRSGGGDRAVAAAIVDEHFVRRGAEPRDVVLLVVERNDDRDVRHGAPAPGTGAALQISYCKNQNLPAVAEFAAPAPRPALAGGAAPSRASSPAAWILQRQCQSKRPAQARGRHCGWGDV